MGLPPALVEELAAASETVASELDGGDACAARASADKLQERTIAAINAGRVPARYQEELTASVGALAASIECMPAPPPVPDDEEDEDEAEERDDDEPKGKGRGKKNGKGGGKG